MEGTLTMPADSELLAVGRRAWITQSIDDAQRQHHCALGRLGALTRAVEKSADANRHETLQDLIACAVNARTQWERLQALIAAERGNAQSLPADQP